MQPNTDALAHMAQQHPDHPAVFQDGQCWDYAALNAMAASCCSELDRLGVRPQQRVGVLMYNDIVYVVLIHALARLGAVLVPLNVRLTVPELKRQLGHANASWLIYGHDVEAHAPALTRDGLGVVPAGRLRLILDDTSDWLRRPLAFDRLQAVVFTSGTTGQPKGSRLTFKNHFWNARGSALRLGTLPQGEERWLLCLPLYHIGGLAIVWRCAFGGACAVILKKFDADEVFEAVLTQGITSLSLVPTMLHRLVARWRSTPPPASLRCILLGGAPPSPALLEQAFDLNLPIAPTYGLTEAASQVATMPPNLAREKPGSVGQPLDGVKLSIIDKRGRPLPAGEVGDIVVGGETVMQGYDGLPAATAQVLDDAGFCTDDLGYLDKDGDLWVLNRRDDMIISGGENVYPSEVEAVLETHPDVVAACVVGVDDPEWGQRVVAAIVARAVRPAEANLIQHCKTALASYKCPRSFCFLREIPTTPSGKVDRWKLRQQMDAHFA